MRLESECQQQYAEPFRSYGYGTSTTLGHSKAEGIKESVAKTVEHKN